MFSLECKHEILSEKISPDSLYVSTVSERRCGAVARDYEIVSIRPRENKFKGEDKKAWVFWIEGRPRLEMAWSSPKSLTVLYESTMGKKKEIDVWKDVGITTREIR
jgi:hypothetical protein